MKKIFLSAGHSIKTVGASSQGTTEAKEAISIVNKVVEVLKTQNLKGRELVLVPHELDLVDTIKWINKNSTNPAYDLCIEVHLNATAGGQGAEVWYYSGIQSSKDFAEELLWPIVKYTGLKNRGLKGDGNNRYGKLGFIRETKPMASLIEIGFIDSKTDLPIIRSKGHIGIAAGILNACGGAYREPVVKPVEPVEKPIVKPVETPKPIETTTTSTEPIKEPSKPLESVTGQTAGLLSVIKQISEIIIEILKKLRG